jgi:hypothetical protein
MVIRVLDHVKQCNTAADGLIVGAVIRKALADGARVDVSFAGVNNAPSSFINAAIVSLLDSYSFDFIRQHLKITNATSQIIDVIRRRFDSETHRSHAA